MLMKRLLFVWTSCLLLVITTASAQVPIPAGPEAPSSKDFDAVERAFMLRTIVEAYKLDGRRDQRWNQVTEHFLEAWVNYTTRAPDALTPDEVLAAGRAVIEAGCDDPVAAYCYGRLLRKQGDPDMAKRYLRKAYDGFENSAYSVSYRSWSASHLALVLRLLGENQEAQRYDALNRKHLVEAISSGIYRPEERRVLFSHIQWMLSNAPLDQVQEIHDAVIEHEGVDPWLVNMIAGRMHVRLAWKVRGGGWAFKVTEEGWKGFYEHFTKARDAFTEAWNLDNGAPESAAGMIEVAMGGSALPGESPRFWFDRAVSAQFDYIPAYQALRWSFMPRWGGSHEAIYAFGRECLQTDRFDTQVPYQLFLSVQAIVGDLFSNLEFYKDEGVNEDLRAMMNGYLTTQANEAPLEWYRSLGAAVAWRGEKWSEARQFLDEMESPPDDDAFTRVGASVQEAVGEIYARSGKLAEPTQKAEDLIASGDFDQAVVAFRDLLRLNEEDDRVASFYRQRLSAVERLRTLSAGDWADILPNKDLDGWRVKSGNWSVNDEGALIGKWGKDGLLLECASKFGARFEIRGKARFVESPYANFNMGVYFGRETGGMENSFRFYRHREYASVYRSNDELSKVELPVQDTNTFRVQRWDNLLYTFVNDNPAQQGVVIQSYGNASDAIVGIGGRYWYNGAVIQFDELQIRTLAEQPVPVAPYQREGDVKNTDSAPDVEGTNGNAEASESDDDLPSDP